MVLRPLLRLRRSSQTRPGEFVQCALSTASVVLGFDPGHDRQAQFLAGVPATREQLRIAIVTWIERTYHRRRRQDRLGRLTPIEYETTMTRTADQAA